MLNCRIEFQEFGPVVSILECAEAMPTKLAALNTVLAPTTPAFLVNDCNLIISPPSFRTYIYNLPILLDNLNYSELYKYIC